MNNPEQHNEEIESPRMAWIQFGLGGHESEYVLHLEDSASDNFIPREIELELAQELGADWVVSNRGTRIEIFSKKNYGHRDDDRVVGGVKGVLSKHNYNAQE